MSSHPGRRICLVPQVSGVGGMVSFRRKMEQGLAERNIQVSHRLDDMPYQAVLVIGGTRQLPQLWRAKRRGIRIVQRLDGMNWLHQVRKSNARHFVRAEYGNWLLAIIRSRLAERIVYQSRFSQDWWERVRGPVRAACRVIYNGVDLSLFTPSGTDKPPTDRIRILMVEGSLLGGYELGLDAAVNLARGLETILRDSHSLSIEAKAVELMVVGRVDEVVKKRYTLESGIPILWAGLVSHDRIPEIDRSAHLLYSSDINPACPNSVIEALACGLPVLAYDTGALPELVVGNSGCVVPYGGDPWKLETPDGQALLEGALHILQKQEVYRRNARERAEETFDLDHMVQDYLNVLLED